MLQTSGINSNTIKAGTCPHGLPFGACPICSGMGGGAQKKADFSAKPGEMSWAECAAIGAFLKAQQMRAQAAKEVQTPIIAIVNFQNGVQSIMQKVANFVQAAQNLPSAISKPISFIAGKLILPALNAIKNAPLAFIQKFADISDKLAAVFGELKAAISKKVSESFKKIKKKLRSIFSIFEVTDDDDTDKKVEETKRKFELKRFLTKIFNKTKEKDKGEKDERTI